MDGQEPFVDVPPITEEEAVRIIATLEDIDLESYSVDEVKALVTPMFRGYATEALTLTPIWRIYRAVRREKRPDHLSQLTYAPANRVPNSRANREGMPLFYGALAARNAALFEQRLAVGDCVAIGCWETTAPILVALLGRSSCDPGASFPLRFKHLA